MFVNCNFQSNYNYFKKGLELAELTQKDMPMA